MSGNLENAEVTVEEVVLIEFIDVEDCVKKGQPIHKAKRYKIRIDKEYKEVTVHEMTGRQILALVNKTPETYLLSEKHRGGHTEPIEADQIVKFHHHEIERFQTLAKDCTEG